MLLVLSLEVRQFVSLLVLHTCGGSAQGPLGWTAGESWVRINSLSLVGRKESPCGRGWLLEVLPKEQPLPISPQISIQLMYTHSH